MNTNPFFIAFFAHFFLVGDRINWHKLVGLALAFYNDRRLIRLHEAVFEAVRRRAPAAARRAMDRHMRAIKNVETVLAKG